MIPIADKAAKVHFIGKPIGQLERFYSSCSHARVGRVGKERGEASLRGASDTRTRLQRVLFDVAMRRSIHTVSPAVNGHCLHPWTDRAGEPVPAEFLELLILEKSSGFFFVTVRHFVEEREQEFGVFVCEEHGEACQEKA